MVVKKSSRTFPAIKITTGASSDKVHTVDSDGDSSLKVLEATNITDSVVTQIKRGALNYAISSSSGVFEKTVAIGWTDITNLSASITVVNRPVLITIVPDGSGNATLVYGTGGGQIRFLRGATEIARYKYITYAEPYIFLDVPSVGAQTYKAQYRILSTGTLKVDYVKFVVIEL
jgi:hypothetical protein